MNYLRLSPVAFSLTVAVLLSGATVLHAGASNKNGNPFGNGTFFSSIQSYSAIVRSSNGFLGAMQFQTGYSNNTTNSLTNSGLATVYAGGFQYVGIAYGTVNNGQLAVTYSGTSPGQSVAFPTVTFDVRYNISNQVSSVTPTYGITNFSTTNNMNGQFSAMLKNSYPIQTFSGTGVTTVVAQVPSYSNSLTPLGSNSYTNYTYNVSNSIINFQTTASGSTLTQQ